MLPRHSKSLDTQAKVVLFDFIKQNAVLGHYSNMFVQKTYLYNTSCILIQIEHLLKQSLAVHNISVLNTVHVWSYENVSDIKDLFVSLYYKVAMFQNFIMQVSDARIMFLNTLIETSKNILCEVK